MARAARSKNPAYTRFQQRPSGEWMVAAFDTDPETGREVQVTKWRPAPAGGGYRPAAGAYKRYVPTAEEAESAAEKRAKLAAAKAKELAKEEAERAALRLTLGEVTGQPKSISKAVPAPEMIDPSDYTPEKIEEMLQKQYKDVYRTPEQMAATAVRVAEERALARAEEAASLYEEQYRSMERAEKLAARQLQIGTDEEQGGRDGDVIVISGPATLMGSDDEKAVIRITRRGFRIGAKYMVRLVLVEDDEQENLWTFAQVNLSGRPLKPHLVEGFLLGKTKLLINMNVGTDDEMTMEMSNRHLKLLFQRRDGAGGEGEEDTRLTIDDIEFQSAPSPLDRYENAVSDDDPVAAEAALRDMDEADLAMIAEDVADEYDVSIKADISSDPKRVRARILKVVFGDEDERRKAAKQARYRAARGLGSYTPPPVQREAGGPGIIVSPGTSPETAASMARLLGVSAPAPQPVVAQPVAAPPPVVPVVPVSASGYAATLRVMVRAARLAPYGEKFMGLQGNLAVQGNMATLTDASGQVYSGELRKSAADNTELRLVLAAPVRAPAGDVASLVLDLNRGTTASIPVVTY